MLVVPSRNQFVRPQKEDWPRADLLSHDITIPLFDVQDFGRGRRLKAGEAYDLVPRNQQQVHPDRPVQRRFQRRQLRGGAVVRGMRH